MPTFGRGVLFACFWSQIAIESGRCFFGSHFPVVLLCNIAHFATEIHFGHEKPEHANAPIDHKVRSENEFILILNSEEKLSTGRCRSIFLSIE